MLSRLRVKSRYISEEWNGKSNYDSELKLSLLRLNIKHIYEHGIHEWAGIMLNDNKHELTRDPRDSEILRHNRISLP
jgi:hypothetical protein